MRSFLRRSSTTCPPPHSQVPQANTKNFDLRQMKGGGAERARVEGAAPTVWLLGRSLLPQRVRRARRAEAMLRPEVAQIDSSMQVKMDLGK